MPVNQKLKSLEEYFQAANDGVLGPLDYLEDESFFEFKSGDYQDVQSHSTCVDKILEIGVQETEKEMRERARRMKPGGTVESWSASLHDGALTWVGLNPAQLQTPYAEIYELLGQLGLQDGEGVVDLGAGYGRMGVILGQLWPSCVFIGYEMSKERVRVGNDAYGRLKMPNARLSQANIAGEDFALPKADYYFIYEFGSKADMKKLLLKLEKRADAGKSFSVLARGRGINSLIRKSAPWLTVEEPVLVGNTTVYKFL